MTFLIILKEYNYIIISQEYHFRTRQLMTMVFRIVELWPGSVLWMTLLGLCMEFRSLSGKLGILGSSKNIIFAMSFGSLWSFIY